MKRKNNAKGAGGIITLMGLIFLFIFPPVGFFILILGILISKIDIKGTQQHTSHHTLQRENQIYQTRQNTPSNKYSYTTSHTENEITQRRAKNYTGTVYLQTEDIASVIGLIRLSRKLAGIKNISLTLKIPAGTKFLNFQSDGSITINTHYPKEAISFIRKAYADNILKDITLKISLKHKEGQKVETLKEIAQNLYLAQVE